MPEWAALAAITFVAAVVNGALGYGFSSLTVPVALLYVSNRVLNPALALVGLLVNGCVVFNNRHAVAGVLNRVLPIMGGMLPGVILGSLAVARIAPGSIKVVTFCLLLPLTWLQVAGWRRPLQSERRVAVPFGAGVGVLYALTTISGPPLVLFLNNQGYVQDEFRASLALIRLTESSLTVAAYSVLGLYAGPGPLHLLHWTVPGVLLGIPLGAQIFRRLSATDFRRVCTGLDSGLVGFGLSRTLVELGWAGGMTASGVFGATLAITAWLAGGRDRQFDKRSQA